MKSPYGPQNKSGNSFTRRMRFHQSWYRAKVLDRPMGNHPRKSIQQRLGSMLDYKSGEAGYNFLNPQIFEEVKKRLAEQKGVVARSRLLCNLLSSQPMCFNLFAPLIRHRELAARVFGAILPTKIDRVTKVSIEHAPEPRKDYLDDETAFDAYAEYIRPDNKRGFVGIETKLTEPFSPKPHDREEYRYWHRKASAPWIDGSMEKLLKIRFNQLWRDHLLAVAMLLRDNSEYAEGYLMLVRHPGDKHCGKTVGRYREMLKPGDDTFIDCPLDKMVSVMESSVQGDEQVEWIAEFRKRYLELELSEAEWEKYKDNG